MVLSLATVAVTAGCEASPGPAIRAFGTLTIVVDSFPDRGSGDLRLRAPDGTVQVLPVRPGATRLLDTAPFGTYTLELDTVRVGDSGITTPRYDASRWLATPASVTITLDAAHADAAPTVRYRKLTGGIAVSATGNAELWVEFLHADGTGCRCTAWGGSGLRTSSSGGSVQDLLPGDYRVHFLPITYFNTPGGGGGAAYTVVPSPETVNVTVRAGEMVQASTAYRVQ